jgi:hypothetical protein
VKRARNYLVLGAALVLLATTVSTKAAEVRLWMDQFKTDYAPLERTSDKLIQYQTPASAGVVNSAGDRTGWQGWAPVNLPVGSAIGSVVYYHVGSTNIGHATVCNFWRVKFGKNPESLAAGHSTAAVPETVSLTMASEDKLIVKSGYRYYVSIFIGATTAMKGVKIIYYPGL